MAKTASTMLPLGTKAPGFSLTDVVSGKHVSLAQTNTLPTASVIMFICNHCPYVKHVNQAVVDLAQDYMPKHVRFIAINANDVKNYPDDSPEQMKKTALELGYPFSYLYDETQEVAKAYQAACTPDFFMFDQNEALVYRGQLDESRPGNGIVPSGASIREALDCLLRGEAVPTQQKPSLGCNIKWKAE